MAVYVDEVYELDNTVYEGLMVQALFGREGTVYALCVLSQGDGSGYVELYRFDKLDRGSFVHAELPDFVARRDYNDWQGPNGLPDFDGDYMLTLSRGTVVARLDGSDQISLNGDPLDLLDLSDLKIYIGADCGPVCITARQGNLLAAAGHRLAVAVYRRNEDEDHPFKDKSFQGVLDDAAAEIMELSLAMYPASS